MRLLVLWGGKGPEMIRFVKQLNQSPHQVVYWVGHTYAAADAARELPGVVFHPHDAAERAEPAPGIHVADFLPPNEALINANLKTESLILTMLNRFCDTMCVDERRHLYFHMLAYWSHVLDQFKPDAIIFDVEPHWAYDFLVFELALRRGIKTLMFNETRVSDRLLWLNNFRVGSVALHAAQLRSVGKNFSLSDLSEDLQTYYTPRSSTTYNAQPVYIEFQKKKFSWRYRWLKTPKIINSLKDGSFFKRAAGLVVRLWRTERSKIFMRPVLALKYALGPTPAKEYGALVKTPDWSKPFVYLALQVQPERTTSPLGDIFCDQLLMTEIVSAALPPGWIIYVKEHPIQLLRFGADFSSNRYRGYYKQLANIPRVQLVPVDTSTYELNNKSQAVVTVTGSPGWEALLRSKPAIVFGYPWYKDCPGVFLVTSVESCKEIFAKIMNGYQFSQQTIINYLKSFDEATIHGYIAPSNAKASKFTQDEGLHNMAEVIRKELVG